MQSESLDSAGRLLVTPPVNAKLVAVDAQSGKCPGRNVLCSNYSIYEILASSEFRLEYIVRQWQQ